MKKIIRIATVSALASVALLFAGCTKDYSADINALNDQVSALSQKVESLQAAIDKGSVITDVTATTNGIKVTLSNGNSYEITNGKDGANGTNGKDGTNGTNGKDGKDGAAGSVITIGADGYWYIDGVKTEYKAQGEKGDKGDTGAAGQDGVNGQDGKDGADGDTIYYRPDVDKNLWIKVTNGVEEETTMQVYAPGTTTAVWDTVNGTLKISNVVKEDGTVGTVTINLGSLLSSLVFCPDLYFEGIEAMEYLYIKTNAMAKTHLFDGATDLEENAEASCSELGYQLGQTIVDMPSIAKAYYYINPKNADVKDITWGFTTLDRNVVTRSTAGTAWTPSTPKLGNIDENGLADFTFTIANGDKLTSAQQGSPVSVISLYGVQKDSTIHSDFAAIAPFKLGLKAIAFKPNGYKTQVPCSLSVSGYETTHLYESIEEAIKNPASVAWKYNAGKLSLNMFDIHTLGRGSKLHEVGTDEKCYTLDAFKEMFPEATLNFSIVKYALGSNSTDESVFGKIDGTDFVPCYAKGEGATAESIVVPEGTEEGISAVGRKPIVCVTLNYNGNVVLAGYFKIKLQKEAPQDPTKVIKDFKLKTFDAFKFICDDQSAESKWVDMSYTILEKELGIDYAQFKADYTWERDKTYVIAESAGVKSYNDGSAFGTVSYVEDSGVGAVNDKFVLSVSYDNIKAVGEGNGKILYAHFTTSVVGSPEVYIGFEFSVLKRPEFTFGTKNPKYWFSEFKNAAEEDNTFRVNVKVPNYYHGDDPTLDDDVMVYTKEVTDNFIEKKIQTTVKPGFESYGALQASKISYCFSPAAQQPKVGKSQIFSVSGDGLTLHYGSAAIATIDSESGLITYQTNDTAKELLNRYRFDSENVDSMLVCSVTVKAAYGTCNIEAGSDSYIARFLRPVNINNNGEAELKDGVPTGDSIELGKLFKANDWQGYDIFKYNPDTDAYEECWYGTEINWYGYYQFKTISIDVAKVETDQTGEKKLISVVNPAAQLWVSKVGSSAKVTGPVDITDIKNLKNYKFNYFNNMGVVKDFKLYVPFTITYSWGTVTDVVEVSVKKTY